MSDEQIVAPVLRVYNKYALEFANNKDNIISEFIFSFVFGVIFGAIFGLGASSDNVSGIIFGLSTSSNIINLAATFGLGFALGIASVFGAKVAVGLTISTHLNVPCPTISSAVHFGLALGAGLTFGFIYGIFFGFGIGLAVSFILFFSALIGSATLNFVLEKL